MPAMAASRRPGRGSLPASLTPLIGREMDIARLKTLLERSRLVTLAGAAGVGKTRLATAAATQVASQLKDGAWFVDLAPLSDPARIPHAIAGAVGVAEHVRRPILESILGLLRKSELLLVLDNCEHLVEECARLADLLLTEAPALRVLATSREPLGVEGETVFTVSPLACPDPRWTDARRIATSPAVRMFASRAALRRPGFAVDRSNAGAVASICRRLDGLPLALELGAAHIGHMPAVEILTRLEHRFELLTGMRTAPARQRTLRATLDWSYSLLADDQRVLFRRLAVFGGTFDAAAVAAICADDLNSVDTMKGLSHLIDKSMITTADPFEDQARFGLLETLREYALDRLKEKGEWDGTRTRHAEHFLAVAEEAAERLERDDQIPALDRLTVDYHNLRAALEWARINSHAMFTRLTAALGWFWHHRSHHSEGRAWLAAALEVETEQTLVRAMLLRQAGLLSHRKGEIAHARRLLDEAVSLELLHGDRIRLGLAMLIQALALMADGELELARTRLDQILAIADETGYHRLTADALQHLSVIAFQLGEIETARTQIDKAIEIARQIRRHSLLAFSLSAGAMVRIQQGEFDAAQGLLRESMRIKSAFHDQYALGMDLDRAAELAARKGRWDRAIRLLGAAQARYESIDDIATPKMLARRELWLPAARRRVGNRWSRLYDEGRRLSDEVSVAYASGDNDALPSHSHDLDGAGLTPREQQVVPLVAGGLTNREIAARLGIAERTVDGHVEHILTKLDMRSRAQIAAWVVRSEVT